MGHFADETFWLVLVNAALGLTVLVLTGIVLSAVIRQLLGPSDGVNGSLE